MDLFSAYLRVAQERCCLKPRCPDELRLLPITASKVVISACRCGQEAWLTGNWGYYWHSNLV